MERKTGGRNARPRMLDIMVANRTESLAGAVKKTDFDSEKIFQLKIELPNLIPTEV